MIEFWYDVGSPASYLAWTQLERIEEETGQKVEMKPMLLGGVFKATGNASPVMVPAKGAWMMKDLGRWAGRYGAPLTLPPSFPINTLFLMRCIVGIEEEERRERLVKAVFEALYGAGAALDDPKVAASVLGEAGFAAEEMMRVAESDEAKARLRTATEEAVSRGVFGAPTFFVGSSMHFGQDRIDWVIETANAA